MSSYNQIFFASTDASWHAEVNVDYTFGSPFRRRERMTCPWCSTINDTEGMVVLSCGKCGGPLEDEDD